MKLKLNIAPYTIRYTDYGDLLGTETGIQWLDADGQPMRRGFEATTIEAIKAKLAPYTDAIELVVHAPMVRTFDMNPHGLI